MCHQQGQRVPGYGKYWAAIDIMRYDVVTAVNIKITVSCDVMPCSLAYVYRRFGSTCCFHFQVRCGKDKPCVIYGSDGWWNGEKEEEEAMQEGLARAVISWPL
jgi:hypothetical protein